MAGFKFKYSEEAATKEVVRGKFVNKSGAYICKILKAKIVEVKGTEKVNLEMQFLTKEGQTFDHKINMIQGDGKENFRMAMVQALIYLLDEPEFDAGNEEVILNAKIGVFFKNVCKKGAEKYNNKDIDGFFDVKTLQTSTEKKAEKEAKTHTMRTREYDRLNEVDELYLAGVETAPKETTEEVEDKNVKEIEKNVADNKPKEKEKEEEEDEFPF